MTTKESIFNSALNLFAQHGYDGTSIRDIVRGVGIKESSFYNHYAGKQDLLVAVLKACEDLFLEQNPAIAERKKLAQQHSMQEVFHILVDRFLAMLEIPQAMQFWLVVSSEQYKNPVASAIVMNEHKRRIEGTIAIFEELQLQGKMEVCDSRKVAQLYIYTIQSLYKNYVLSKFHNGNSQQYLTMMLETIDLLANLYKKPND